jgi:RimJ/RimL family protein N-acetyltransferase
MQSHQFLEDILHFDTERLQVSSWRTYAAAVKDSLAISERIISIMTPEVTKSLPPGWQNIDSVEKANEWIDEMLEESALFTIQLMPEGSSVGFLFLYAMQSTDQEKMDLRLGYLLSEETWGKGLGSELIHGLVHWCEKSSKISSISGGVEVGNLASIRVLEKNGFAPEESEDSPEDMIYLKKTF